MDVPTMKKVRQQDGVADKENKGPSPPMPSSGPKKQQKIYQYFAPKQHGNKGKKKETCGTRHRQQQQKQQQETAAHTDTVASTATVTLGTVALHGRTRGTHGQYAMCFPPAAARGSSARGRQERAGGGPISRTNSRNIDEYLPDVGRLRLSDNTKGVRGYGGDGTATSSSKDTPDRGVQLPSWDGCRQSEEALVRRPIKLAQSNLTAQHDLAVATTPGMFSPPRGGPELSNIEKDSSQPSARSSSSFSYMPPRNGEPVDGYYDPSATAHPTTSRTSAFDQVPPANVGMERWSLTWKSMPTGDHQPSSSPERLSTSSFLGGGDLSPSSLLRSQSLIHQTQYMESGLTEPDDAVHDRNSDRDVLDQGHEMYLVHHLEMLPRQRQLHERGGDATISSDARNALYGETLASGDRTRHDQALKQRESSSPSHPHCIAPSSSSQPTYLDDERLMTTSSQQERRPGRPQASARSDATQSRSPTPTSGIGYIGGFHSNASSACSSPTRAADREVREMNRNEYYRRTSSVRGQRQHQQQHQQKYQHQHQHQHQYQRHNQHQQQKTQFIMRDRQLQYCDQHDPDGQSDLSSASSASFGSLHSASTASTSAYLALKSASPTAVRDGAYVSTDRFMESDNRRGRSAAGSTRSRSRSGSSRGSRSGRRSRSSGTRRAGGMGRQSPLPARRNRSISPEVACFNSDGRTKFVISLPSSTRKTSPDQEFSNARSKPPLSPRPDDKENSKPPLSPWTSPCPSPCTMSNGKVTSCNRDKSGNGSGRDTTGTSRNDSIPSECSRRSRAETPPPQTSEVCDHDSSVSGIAPDDNSPPISPIKNIIDPSAGEMLNNHHNSVEGIITRPSAKRCTSLENISGDDSSYSGSSNYFQPDSSYAMPFPARKETDSFLVTKVDYGRLQGWSEQDSSQPSSAAAIVSPYERTVPYHNAHGGRKIADSQGKSMVVTPNHRADASTNPKRLFSGLKRSGFY